MEVSIHPGSSSSVVFVDFANRCVEHHFWLGSQEMEFSNIVGREGTDQEPFGFKGLSRRREDRARYFHCVLRVYGT